MTIMNIWELNILDCKAENLESSRNQANLLSQEQAARRISTTALGSLWGPHPAERSANGVAEFCKCLPLVTAKQPFPQLTSLLI